MKETTHGMRYLLAVAGILVLIIGTPLFVLPGNTSSLFAWTINPPLTAAFLGASYWASFVLEFLCSREKVWARARVAVPAVLIFTTLTLIVTLIHFDKFHFFSKAPGSFAWGIAWVWLVVYVTVPVIMSGLLVHQMRKPGDDPDRQSIMPSWFRIVLIVQAIVMLVLGTAMLLAPQSVGPSVWPWALSALTGRSIGAWLVGFGIAAGFAAWENDFRRVRAAMIALSLLGILHVVSLVRFATALHPKTGEPVLDWSDPRTVVYLVFVISLGLIGVYGWVAYRRGDRIAQLRSP